MTSETAGPRTPAGRAILEAFETRRRYLLHEPGVTWTEYHNADAGSSAVIAIEREAVTLALTELPVEALQDAVDDLIDAYTEACHVTGLAIEENTVADVRAALAALIDKAVPR